jgi:hypothetical protein
MIRPFITTADYDTGKAEQTIPSKRHEPVEKVVSGLPICNDERRISDLPAASRDQGAISLTFSTGSHDCGKYTIVPLSGPFSLISVVIPDTHAARMPALSVDDDAYGL